MFSVKSSILVAVEIIFAPWNEVGNVGRLVLAFGVFLDAVQLVLPEALKGAGPLVERADGFGVGAIEHAPAVSAYLDQADIFEDTQVLGDRGLLHAQTVHDVTDGAFLKGEIAQDVAAAGLGDGVEGIG